MKTPEKDPWDFGFKKNPNQQTAQEAFDKSMSDVDEVIEKLKYPKWLTYISELMRALRIFCVNMFNQTKPINWLDLTDKMANQLEEKKQMLLQIGDHMEKKQHVSFAYARVLDYLVYLIEQALLAHAIDKLDTDYEEMDDKDDGPPDEEMAEGDNSETIVETAETGRRRRRVLPLFRGGHRLGKSPVG